MIANPVLLQELRVRMRGGSAYSLLTAIILAFGALTFATYWVITHEIRPVAAQAGTLVAAADRGAPIERLLIAQRGPIFLLVMALWAVILAALIIPASTSGVFSRDREVGSLLLLLSTPLRPLHIVAGKLLASVSYVLLIVAAAVPLFSIVVMFGGVSLDQAINVVIVLVVTTFAFGAIGTFLSAVARNSLLASLLTYTVVLLVTFGSYAAYLAGMPLARVSAVRYALYFSPLGAMVSALTQTNPQLSTLVGRFFQEPGTHVGGEWWSVGNYPLWYVSSMGYLVVGLLLLFFASRAISPLRRRFG